MNTPRLARACALLVALMATPGAAATDGGGAALSSTSVPTQLKPLPTNFNALLLRVTPQPELLGEAFSPWVLLVPDQAPRVLATKEGVPLTDAMISALRITGRGGVVHVEGAATCAPDRSVVCAKKVTRIDKAPRLPLDVGSALDDALAPFRDLTTPENERLQSATKRLAQAVALPKGAKRSVEDPAYRGTRTSFWPSWDDATQTLRVLVVARSFVAWSVEEANSDARAGQFACDAPPGADCAPSCIPSAFRTTKVVTTEAAIERSFSRDGRAGATVERGATTSEPATLERSGIERCRR